MGKCTLCGVQNKILQRSDNAPIKLQLKGQQCMDGTAHCTHRNMQSNTARLKNAVVRSTIIFIEYVTGNTLVTQTVGSTGKVLL